ncbi:hypothetical protein [Azonexus sp.]|uniref:hypothetical protein n=1 Tax=Azonexus sp. TaxID=1872668 RepID=UPI0027B980E1|nr:hypothetical protein [Azonexus sp.]
MAFFMVSQFLMPYIRQLAGWVKAVILVGAINSKEGILPIYLRADCECAICAFPVSRHETLALDNGRKIPAGVFMPTMYLTDHCSATPVFRYASGVIRLGSL